MDQSVSEKVKNLTNILKTWKGVRAIVLQHFAEKDIYDPNFSLTLDVFRDGDIPEKNKRQQYFPMAQYFDTSHIKERDRFLVDDLPVRISYKDCRRVNSVLDALDKQDWMTMERGTYLFHRISTGTVTWERDDWINTIRMQLDNLPPEFWLQWLESCRQRLSHFLGDMGAAGIKGDELYFRLSLASFLKVSAELLFAVNQVFEPGPRDFTATLTLLENIPEGFNASWESLVREDTELQGERKYELADHLARSLLSLEP